MNKLEELSKKDKANYQLYLKRMTESMKYSTKGLIPILASEAENILDVGCGSGVMLNALEKNNHKAILTGLDLNVEAINKLKMLGKDWKLYHMDFMDLSKVKYDAIIFSSILHEISSYYPDIDLRFTDIPIYQALLKANALLKKDGFIVLRDGLLVSKNNWQKKCIIRFVNPKDSLWLYKFKRDFCGFDKLNINKTIINLPNNEYKVNEVFLKEFLYTFTWGEESYPREINERFGILSKEEWQELIKLAGFKIDTIIESREEYEKYLSKRIIIMDENRKPYEYPSMAITIKAHKDKSLKKLRMDNKGNLMYNNKW